MIKAIRLFESASASEGWINVPFFSEYGSPDPASVKRDTGPRTRSLGRRNAHCIAVRFLAPNQVLYKVRKLSLKQSVNSAG